MDFPRMPGLRDRFEELAEAYGAKTYGELVEAVENELREISDPLIRTLRSRRGKVTYDLARLVLAARGVEYRPRDLRLLLDLRRLYRLPAPGRILAGPRHENPILTLLGTYGPLRRYIISERIQRVDYRDPLELLAAAYDRVLLKRGKRFKRKRLETVKHAKGASGRYIILRKDLPRSIELEKRRVKVAEVSGLVEQDDRIIPVRGRRIFTRGPRWHVKERIRRFYESREPDLLLEVIGEQDFGRREFAIASYPEGKIVRNLFFYSPDELKRFLVENTPVKAYVGSVYVRNSEKIPSGTSVGELSVDYRELTFDIDLTDYNDVRREIDGCTCRREGKRICPKCRPLANRALVILRRLAEEFFGTDRYKAFFSGRRGVHFRIYDDQARKLDDDGRLRLARILQVVHPTSSLDPATVVKPVRSHTLRLIIFEETILYRLRNEGVRKLTRLLSRRGLYGPRGYLKAIKGFLETGKRSPEYHEVVERFFEEAFDAVKDLVRKFYVRIDLKALTDSKRLMKIPGSLDASTMAVVEEIPREEFETRMPEILRRRA